MLLCVFASVAAASWLKGSLRSVALPLCQCHPGCQAPAKSGLPGIAAVLQHVISATPSSSCSAGSPLYRSHACMLMADLVCIQCTQFSVLHGVLGAQGVPSACRPHPTPSLAYCYCCICSVLFCPMTLHTLTPLQQQTGHGSSPDRSTGLQGCRQCIWSEVGGTG